MEVLTMGFDLETNKPTFNMCDQEILNEIKESNEDTNTKTLLNIYREIDGY